MNISHKALSLFSIVLFLSAISFAQPYTGYGYAEKVVGKNYKMPGTKISAESGEELNIDGVVSMYNFDVANLSGPDFNSDNGIVFGIYTNGIPGDGGGSDIRKYSTSASTAYTPIRWNNGSQMFRQSGQWVRYSIDFEKGRFNFMYRGNIAGFANPKHKFDLRIF